MTARAELRFRIAGLADAPLLARLNAALHRDEGHENRMTTAQLEQRMLAWLAHEYTAVLFLLDDDVVAYALHRDNEGRGVHLRQFFVVPEQRRKGLGRAAIDLLRRDLLPPGTRIVLDVLVGNAPALAFWRALGCTDYAIALELR